MNCYPELEGHNRDKVKVVIELSHFLIKNN